MGCHMCSQTLCCKCGRHMWTEDSRCKDDVSEHYFYVCTLLLGHYETWCLSNITLDFCITNQSRVLLKFCWGCSLMKNLASSPLTAYIMS